MIKINKSSSKILFFECHELVLHAGTHKTATTEFQENLLCESRITFGIGLFYPINYLLPENFK